MIGLHELANVGFGVANGTFHSLEFFFGEGVVTFFTPAPGLGSKLLFACRDLLVGGTLQCYARCFVGLLYGCRESEGENGNNGRSTV